MPHKVVLRSSLAAAAAVAFTLAGPPLLASAQTAQPASAQATVALPGASCSAYFFVVAQWPGGYEAEVVVVNTGSVALTGWTVTVTFPTQQMVIVSGPSNGTLAPGASASEAFLGTGSPSGTPKVTCIPQ